MSSFSRKAAFVGLLLAAWAATCTPSVFASTIAAGDDLKRAACPFEVCPWLPRSHARSLPDDSLTEGDHTWIYHSVHSIRLALYRTALPAFELYMRLLHSIGAADVDLDDAWGSDTFDSSDATIPKQAAGSLDDLSAAPKAKVQSAPVKPKVSAALGTGTPTAAAKCCASLTRAKPALLHLQACSSCTTAARTAAKPCIGDLLCFAHRCSRVLSWTLPATAVLDMESLNKLMQGDFGSSWAS